MCRRDEPANAFKCAAGIECRSMRGAEWMCPDHDACRRTSRRHEHSM